MLIPSLLTRLLFGEDHLVTETTVDPGVPPELTPGPALRWILEASATDVAIGPGDRLTRVTMLLNSPNPIRLRSVTDAETGVLVTPSRVVYSLRRGGQEIATAPFAVSAAGVRAVIDDADVRSSGPDDTLTITAWPANDRQPTVRVYGVEYQRV